MIAQEVWIPPKQVTREELVKLSRDTLAKSNIPWVAREDIFRIRVLDMDWDIGTIGAFIRLRGPTVRRR